MKLPPVLRTLALLTCVASVAWGQEQECPPNLCGCLQTSLCDCIGGAAAFDVTAIGLKVKPLRAPATGTHVSGALCVAGTGPQFTAPSPAADVKGTDGDANTVGAFVLGAPSNTTGALFTSLRLVAPGGTAPTTIVSGDLVTSGAGLLGLENVQVGGALDTSGSDPRVAACQAAPSDTNQAGFHFTPGQTTTPIRVLRGLAGDHLTLSAGTGVRIFWIGRLVLKGDRDGVTPARLTIEMGPGTDAVIVNADAVSLKQCIVDVVGGDARKVLLHSRLNGPTVRISDCTIHPILFAPDRRARIADSAVSNVYAQSLQLTGVRVGSAAGGTSELACPAP